MYSPVNIYDTLEAAKRMGSNNSIDVYMYTIKIAVEILENDIIDSDTDTSG